MDESMEELRRCWRKVRRRAQRRENKVEKRTRKCGAAQLKGLFRYRNYALRKLVRQIEGIRRQLCEIGESRWLREWDTHGEYM